MIIGKGAHATQSQWAGRGLEFNYVEIIAAWISHNYCSNLYIE